MASTRCIYFVDYDMRATTWGQPAATVNSRQGSWAEDDSGLLLELARHPPDYRHARAPRMGLRGNTCCDYLQPENLRKRLMVKFYCEDTLNYGHVSRKGPSSPGT